MINQEKNPLVSVFLNRFFSLTGIETRTETTKQQIVDSLNQLGFDPHNNEVNNTLIVSNPNSDQVLNHLHEFLNNNRILAVRTTGINEISKAGGLNTYTISRKTDLEPISNLDFPSLAMVEIFSRIKPIKHQLNDLTNSPKNNLIDLGGGFRLNIIGLQDTVEKHELAKIIYTADFGFNNCLPRDLGNAHVPKVKFNFSLPVMEEPFLLPPKLVAQHQKIQELQNNSNFLKKDTLSAIYIAKLSLSNLLFSHYHQINNTSLALLANYPSLSGANGFEGQWALLKDNHQVGNFKTAATIFDIESYWSLQTFTGLKNLPTDVSISNFSRDFEQILNNPVWKSLSPRTYSSFKANINQNEKLLVRQSVLSGC